MSDDNKALIVVDMQNCFCSKGGMIYVEQAEQQIPIIKKTVEDYKSKNIPIIYTAVVWGNQNEIPLGLQNNMPPILANWDKHGGLKRGVWGAEIHSELKGLEDYTIEKKSFDAFYNTDSDTYTVRFKQRMDLAMYQGMQ